MLSLLPHAGLSASFTCVRCFHAPTAPLQTSGGCVPEARITAHAPPSAESERLDTSPPAPKFSAPVQSVSVFPVAGSIMPTDIRPRTPSLKIIFPDDSHAIHAGELVRFGVRFFAPPSGLLASVE